MTKRKFYRTTITLEILSEHDIGGLDIQQVVGEMVDGELSGRILEWIPERIGGRTAAMLLMKQGSDPGFFGLDEKGNEVQE